MPPVVAARPKGGGLIDQLKAKGPGGIPRWVLAIGVGAGAYLIWRWYSNSQAASTGQGTTDTSGGFGATGSMGTPLESTGTAPGAESTGSLGTCPDGSLPGPFGCGAAGGAGGSTAGVTCPDGYEADPSTGGCIQTNAGCPPGYTPCGVGGCCKNVKGPCPPGQSRGPRGGCRPNCPPGTHRGPGGGCIGKPNKPPKPKPKHSKIGARR